MIWESMSSAVPDYLRIIEGVIDENKYSQILKENVKAGI